MTRLDQPTAEYARPHSTPLRDTAIILLAAAAGACLMFMLDPQAGRRRRKLVVDQFTHMGHLARKRLRQRRAYARNWGYGKFQEARARVTEGPVLDEILCQRVRAQMGRGVRHTSGLGVIACDGVVTLRGPILAEEVDRLIENVRKCRGVREVINELEVHVDAGHIPALQG